MDKKLMCRIQSQMLSPRGRSQALLTRQVLGHKEDKSNSSLNYVKGKVKLSSKSKEGETRCRSF